MPVSSPPTGPTWSRRRWRTPRGWAGGIVPAFALHGVNRIPLERGLGSSAAACVAGISLADRLLDLGLEPEEVLELAVEIEGHPDNAAAAIAGGFTLAFGDGVIRLDPHPDLAAGGVRAERHPAADRRGTRGAAIAGVARGCRLQRRTCRRHRGRDHVRTRVAHADPGRSLARTDPSADGPERERVLRSAPRGGRPRLRLGRRPDACSRSSSTACRCPTRATAGRSCASAWPPPGSRSSRPETGMPARGL